MKVIFDTPVSDGDITRHAITTEYIHVSDTIFRAYPDGRELSVEGLTASDANIHAAFLDMVARNLKDEYQTGAVTARKAAKQPQGAQE